MDVEMETSPSYFDPEDLTIREQFRIYRKRHSTSSASTPEGKSASKFSEAGLLYDGQTIHSPTNVALLLENIKQEAETFDVDYSEISTAQYSSRRRLSTGTHGVPDVDANFDSIRSSLKDCNQLPLKMSINVREMYRYQKAHAVSPQLMAK